MLYCAGLKLQRQLIGYTVQSVHIHIISVSELGWMLTMCTWISLDNYVCFKNRMRYENVSVILLLSRYNLIIAIISYTNYKIILTLKLFHMCTYITFKIKIYITLKRQHYIII